MNMKEYNYKEEEQGNMLACEPSSWGGQWTEDKLDAFEKYVNAYLTIMNSHREKYHWKLIYFDGFAGSGSRNDDSSQAVSELMLDLFKDEYIDEEELNTYKGAAERVLGIKQNGFDQYVFVDKNKNSSQQLKNQLEPFAQGRNLVFQTSDANEQVITLAKAMHQNKNLASLILLDPFGMQVDWKSIELLKGTRTDLWILIPTGVIVNRLLDRKGELTYIDKLTSFFGKDESFLKDYFYKKKTVDTLFGEKEIIEKVKKPIEKIAELYIEQLNTIFDHVTEKPLVLYNSRKTPIFHFACASNNSTAIKIASQIIDKKQSK
ncbi:MAG: three-Cys-motif partner protein TcmP [Bacteroidaceae bacterium]|nr:three-Cys-motif partner protein TcmP [Bacteroidaceae bacterium]